MEGEWLQLIEQVSKFGVLPSLIFGALVAWKGAGLLASIKASIVASNMRLTTAMETMHKENRDDISEIKERTARIEGHLGIGQ